MSLSRGGDGTGKSIITCNNCGIVKEVEFKHRNRRFCSRGCSTSWKNKNHPELTHNREANRKRWDKLRNNQIFITNNLKSITNARKFVVNKPRAWTKTKKPPQEEMNRIYGKKGVLNNMYGRPPSKMAGRGKQGLRSDLGHWVRSSWEANFARILKYENIYYSYEPQVFKLGETTYTPDFLIMSDMYIEIVGYMDERHKLKISKFREKFPDKNLIVIEKKEYKQLLEKYGKLITLESYTGGRFI
jgi:hypothetical protein